MNGLIKHKLELLPSNPGCYLHKDKFGNIIYVGKAKNLKNRVRSYFRGSHDTKTELLVSEIADFEFIVTESNIEALLLEINLIQENMPKFNIRLKDGKSYPFIKITKELYPRLLITRQVKKDGGLYFGPYPDSGAANEIKKLLDRIFPFKKCKNPANKVCFYYHIGQCNAHTICHTTEDYWQGLVEDVKNFLNGHDDKIVNQLKAKMKDMSDQMAFERAAEYRDLIEAVSTLRTKQRVIRQDMQDRDIFGYYVDKGWMCVHVFIVRQGKLIQRDVNMFPYYNDAEEDFLTYMGQFYLDSRHLKPKEIFIPGDIDQESVEALVGDEVKVFKPKRGEKKQLVNLATKNARVSLPQKFDLLEKDFLPIICPIGFDDNCQSYNINADDAACAIARAVKAEKLAFLTDVEGVYADPKDKDTLISELTTDHMEELLNSGNIGGGMLPKLQNCLDAVLNGVSRVHIMDGRIAHCLLLEIFTNKCIGTAILKADDDHFYTPDEK